MLSPFALPGRCRRNVAPTHLPKLHFGFRAVAFDVDPVAVIQNKRDSEFLIASQSPSQFLTTSSLLRPVLPDELLAFGRNDPQPQVVILQRSFDDLRFARVTIPCLRLAS